MLCCIYICLTNYNIRFKISLNRWKYAFFCISNLNYYIFLLIHKFNYAFLNIKLNNMLIFSVYKKIFKIKTFFFQFFSFYQSMNSLNYKFCFLLLSFIYKTSSFFFILFLKLKQKLQFTKQVMYC